MEGTVRQQQAYWGCWSRLKPGHVEEEAVNRNNAPNTAEVHGPTSTPRSVHPLVLGKWITVQDCSN